MPKSKRKKWLVVYYAMLQKYVCFVGGSLQGPHISGVTVLIADTETQSVQKMQKAITGLTIDNEGNFVNPMGARLHTPSNVPNTLWPVLRVNLENLLVDEIECNHTSARALIQEAYK